MEKEYENLTGNKGSFSKGSTIAHFFQMTIQLILIEARGKEVLALV